MADAQPTPLVAQSLRRMQEMWDALAQVERGAKVKTTALEMRQWSSALSVIERALAATPSPPVAAPPATPGAPTERQALLVQVYTLLDQCAKECSNDKVDLQDWLMRAWHHRVQPGLPQPQPAQPLTGAPGRDTLVLVPLKFVQGFRDIAHNYQLQAVPPDYYHGVEGDAFRDAYSRCGADLKRLRDILTAPSTPTAGTAHGQPT